jgi:hypothetical protein
MRVALVVLAALVVTGCGGGGKTAEDAEAQFRIVAKKGTDRDRCDAAGKVADAWLERKDAEKYAEWRNTRDIYCASAAR